METSQSCQSFGTSLKLKSVVPGLCVEHDDRVGIEILALARADCEIGSRIAAGDVQQPGFWVERVRGPGSAAADRYAGRVFPGRRVERALALRSADDVALGLGNQKEFPDDLAGLRVERVHATLGALEVSARIAHEDEPVPGNRCCRHDLVQFRVRDGRFPNSLAGLEVIGEHPAVLGAAKQHAVQVGGTAIRRHNVERIVLVRSPIQRAGRRVEREDVEHGRADQCVFHHDQTGLEGAVFTDVVSAQDLQLADILRIDLAELRVTIRSDCSVVARPVSGGGARRWRVGGRRGRNSLGGFVSRIQFRRCRARRCRGNNVVARQTRKYRHLHRVKVVKRAPCGCAYHTKRGSDHKELLYHARLLSPFSIVITGHGRIFSDFRN